MLWLAHMYNAQMPWMNKFLLFISYALLIMTANGGSHKYIIDCYE